MRLLLSWCSRRGNEADSVNVKSPPRHLGGYITFFLLAIAAAHAQSVRWVAGDSGLANSAQLIFENCAPDGEPQMPTLPGVTFTRVGQTQSTSIVNFQMTQSVILTYVIRGRQGGPVAIPAFTVKTDKGAMRVDAFTVAGPSQSLESVASAKLVPERTTVWAGEVFGLNYELMAARRTNPQIPPTFDWNSAPLVAEDWSKPEVSDPVINGERRIQVIFRTRAYAKAPNTLKLEAANHVLGIQTGTIGFGIISQPRIEQVSVTSNQPMIEVKALPTAPVGFSGAVGQFKLASKIVPEKAAIGEPVTWTLELSGVGNWPDIAGLPSRDVSNDFQVVQPKAKRTPTEGKLFNASLVEDVVLVPTKPGTYTLGPLNFVYFDPKTGTYQRETVRPVTLTISAPVAPQFSAPQSQAAPPVPEPAAKAAPPPAPEAPGPIPGDPLSGSDETGAPLTTAALVRWIVLPFGLVALFWLALAVRRAKQTDPVRPRREARDRIARTLAHLQGASEQERPGLLLAWQRDTILLWQLRQAAPSARAVPDPAWSKLWEEADRAIYGATTALPPDWIARGQEALVAKRLPGFKPLRLFLPQNLMPFAALFTLLLLAPVTALLAAAAADAPLDAYRKGEFEAAEKGWRSRVATAPTDWIARYNLSLALSQQERFGEAAGQAAAAFVQSPAEPAGRWQFALAAEKSGAAPEVLAKFLAPGPTQALGGMMSAVDWQRLALVAAWIAAAAIGVTLHNSYGRRSVIVGWLAVAIFMPSVLAIGAGLAGANSYGTAAHPDAVVVARPATLRSIPTEADTTQKTTPLAAGSLALQDKSFLGDRWVRLSFENGQTGWVRKEEIVGLWK